MSYPSCDLCSTCWHHCPKETPRNPSTSSHSVNKYTLCHVTLKFHKDTLYFLMWFANRIRQVIVCQFWDQTYRVLHVSTCASALLAFPCKHASVGPLKDETHVDQSLVTTISPSNSQPTLRHRNEPREDLRCMSKKLIVICCKIFVLASYVAFKGNRGVTNLEKVEFIFWENCLRFHFEASQHRSLTSLLGWLESNRSRN